MAETTLNDCRILVVEDEYMLADELRHELETAGAVVLGPVGTLAEATALIRDGARIDGALLDTNLGGEPVFGAADLLMSRGVPIIFTTGYDASAIPARFGACPRCEKPVSMRRVLQIMDRLLHR